ncbi:MAG: bromoperoxidase, partial [Gammaproteobacteria bacterium]
VFRGSSPKVEEGPFLTQFLWIGNDLPSGESVGDGYIGYGALKVDQRVSVAQQQNYMIDPKKWLQVQNGADVRDNAILFGEKPNRRFISTPRDLATYVHDDALYESYLNACLILLGMNAPTDPAFDKLSGSGRSFLNGTTNAYGNAGRARQAGGFALYGGPHILTLVTEVATRALKAVRYQKFNTHCRLRPEALAARIEKREQIQNAFPVLGSRFSDLAAAIKPTVTAVMQTNSAAGFNTAFL